MHRNLTAVTLRADKRAKQSAIRKNKRMPDGSSAMRAENIRGERHDRRILRRNFNRVDRRAANMQTQAARTNYDMDITGRPFVNLMTATVRKTS